MLNKRTHKQSYLVNAYSDLATDCKFMVNWLSSHINREKHKINIDAYGKGSKLLVGDLEQIMRELNVHILD